MRKFRAGVLLAICTFAASCGVPQAALQQAQLEAQQLQTLPADDASVRQMLAGQGAAWQAFSQLLHQNQFGGIWQVDSTFIDSADQTAAIAARQAQVISAGQDDPALNRQMLQQLQARWQQSERYLGQ